MCFYQEMFQCFRAMKSTVFKGILLMIHIVLLCICLPEVGRENYTGLFTVLLAFMRKMSDDLQILYYVVYLETRWECKVDVVRQKWASVQRRA